MGPVPPAPALPERTEEELAALAVEAYNRRGPSDGREERWSRQRQLRQEFLDRIAVNYTRHELTGYEEQMLRTSGRVGTAAARGAIQAWVLGAIAEAYPWLATACDLQEARYQKRERE